MSIRSTMGYYKGVSFNASLTSDTAWTNASLKAAPGTGYAIYITDIDICCGETARTFSLLDGSGGATIWEQALVASTSYPVSLKTPLKLTAATALCLTSSGASVGAFVGVNGFVAEA